MSHSGFGESREGRDFHAGGGMLRTQNKRPRLRLEYSIQGEVRQLGDIHSGPVLVFLLKTKHFREGVNDQIYDL